MGIEREAGNGRADIIMRRNSPAYPNIVVELKKSRSDDPEDLERMAEEGLRQIRTREYYRSLKGKTYLYGVCLQNKKAKVLFEEMDL